MNQRDFFFVCLVFCGGGGGGGSGNLRRNLCSRTIVVNNRPMEGSQKIELEQKFNLSGVK